MAEYKVVDAEKLDADLSSVADAIRTKGGTTESLPFPQGFVDAVGAIESGGGTEEIENIIDQSGVLDSTDGTATEKVEQVVDLAQWEQVWYEASERMVSAQALFKTYQGKTLPRTNLISATSLNDFMSNNDSIADSDCKVEYIDYYLDTKKCGSFSGCFRNCYNLKWLVGINTSNATNVSGMFLMCSALETIQRPLDFSKVTNTNAMFNGANAIKNISFVENSIKKSITIWSPVLSDESIQSIIDGLATVETAQTLTLHADVKAKLTQTQLDTITNKNWNLA